MNIELRSYYKRIILKRKIKFDYERIKGKRPAWIKVKLPKGSNFIGVFLGKKGIEGQRIQYYRKYLPEGLFLPIDYNKEEMRRFYDKFAETYDSELIRKKSGNRQNLYAAEFLIKKIKRYMKDGEMLDLGAGTGLTTEIFVKKGFYPATLVDYSKGMLDKAKKRKSLEGCAFIKKDIRKLELNKKFDLVLGLFSFVSNSYFDREELKKILKIADKHLKKGGIFAVLGYLRNKEFEKTFKKLDTGTYDLSKTKRFYVDYFIGKKK